MFYQQNVQNELYLQNVFPLKFKCFGILFFDLKWNVDRSLWKSPTSKQLNGFLSIKPLPSKICWQRVETSSLPFPFKSDYLKLENCAWKW